MANLTKDQLNRIERDLRDRQELLTEEVKEKRESAANGPNEDRVGVVGDVGDESVSRMLTDLDIEEAGRDLEELRDIDGALQRIADGTYGICETCGGDIDYRRLEAQPTATRCVVCQAQHKNIRAQGYTYLVGVVRVLTSFGCR